MIRIFCLISFVAWAQSRHVQYVYTMKSEKPNQSVGYIYRSDNGNPGIYIQLGDGAVGYPHRIIQQQQPLYQSVIPAVELSHQQGSYPTLVPRHVQNLPTYSRPQNSPNNLHVDPEHMLQKYAHEMEDKNAMEVSMEQESKDEEKDPCENDNTETSSDDHIPKNEESVNENDSTEANDSEEEKDSEYRDWEPTTDNESNSYEDSDHGHDSAVNKLLNFSEEDLYGKVGSNSNDDLREKDGTGLSYVENHYSKKGASEKKGHNTVHHFDDADKEERGKQGHKKFYNKGANNNHHFYDDAAKFLKYYLGHIANNEADFSENKSHKKGHKTKGFHNVYHKDEYKKEHLFYDDENDQGHFNKLGAVKAKNAYSNKGHNDTGKILSSSSHDSYGKNGFNNEERQNRSNQGHKQEDGLEGYYEQHKDFLKKGYTSGSKNSE